jgi:hypothetical protein
MRGLLPRLVLPQILALLEMLNVSSASSKICGNPIASVRSAVRKQDCESKYFATARRDQREFHVALANEADRQKRSGDASLRKTFIITGISEPFD